MLPAYVYNWHPDAIHGSKLQPAASTRHYLCDQLSASSIHSFIASDAVQQSCIFAMYTGQYLTHQHECSLLWKTIPTQIHETHSADVSFAEPYGACILRLGQCPTVLQSSSPLSTPGSGDVTPGKKFFEITEARSYRFPFARFGLQHFRATVFVPNIFVWGSFNWPPASSF
jgi:hypothetical protein